MTLAEYIVLFVLVATTGAGLPGPGELHYQLGSRSDSPGLGVITGGFVVANGLE